MPHIPARTQVMPGPTTRPSAMPTSVRRPQTDDKPEHVEGSRAERDANPALLRPPLKGVCQHRVDSYGCQHERRGCEDRAADNAVVTGSVAESPNSIPKASGETQSATRTPTEIPTTTSHISFPRDHPQDAARS